MTPPRPVDQGGDLFGIATCPTSSRSVLSRTHLHSVSTSSDAAGLAGGAATRSGERSARLAIRSRIEKARLATFMCGWIRCGGRRGPPWILRTWPTWVNHPYSRMEQPMGSRPSRPGRGSRLGRCIGDAEHRSPMAHIRGLAASADVPVLGIARSLTRRALVGRRNEPTRLRTEGMRTTPTRRLQPAASARSTPRRG